MSLRSLDEVAAELERRHAEDQDTIASELVLALWPLWQVMDFENLDQTSVLWTEAALPRIKTAYLQSQKVAAAFASNVRFATLATADTQPLLAPNVEDPAGIPRARVELPGYGVSDSEPISFDEFPEDDVRTTLLVESNYRVKSHMPLPAEDAMAAAQTNSTGGAVRQSLKGARSVTNNVVQFDRKVLGYARVTDGNPCHFCALLASRGAVYSKSSFAVSDPSFTKNANAPKNLPRGHIDISKVHNGCRCTLRPVYSRSHEFDADATFYKAQWEKIFEENQGKSPNEILQIWRDNYQPYQRQSANVVDLTNALREREQSLIDAGFDPLSPQVIWAQRAPSLLA